MSCGGGEHGEGGRVLIGKGDGWAHGLVSRGFRATWIGVV